MSEDEQKETSRMNPIMGLILALVIAGVGGSYFFYNKSKTVEVELSELQKQMDENQPEAVQAVLDEVGKLIELPEDETPTLATIKTTENLADHPFLSKGKEGDRLLIYTGEKLVVMYRPETNKIVAVGTVTISQAGGEEGGEEGEGEGEEGEGEGEESGGE